MGADLQRPGDTSCDAGFSKSLDCRNRDVSFFSGGHIKCLAFEKGIDCRDGKPFYLDSHFTSFDRFIGVDFALVSKKWTV